MEDKAQGEAKPLTAVEKQRVVSAISLDDAKPSSFMKELTESLAKKEAPLIDETRLKTGQDWSVLATQVVGCER